MQRIACGAEALKLAGCVGSCILLKALCWPPGSVMLCACRVVMQATIPTSQSDGLAALAPSILTGTATRTAVSRGDESPDSMGLQPPTKLPPDAATVLQACKFQQVDVEEQQRHAEPTAIMHTEAQPVPAAPAPMAAFAHEASQGPIGMAEAAPADLGEELSLDMDGLELAAAMPSDAAELALTLALPTLAPGPPAPFGVLPPEPDAIPDGDKRETASVASTEAVCTTEAAADSILSDVVATFLASEDDGSKLPAGIAMRSFAGSLTPSEASSASLLFQVRYHLATLLFCMCGWGLWEWLQSSMPCARASLHQCGSLHPMLPQLADIPSARAQSVIRQTR